MSDQFTVGVKDFEALEAQEASFVSMTSEEMFLQSHARFEALWAMWTQQIRASTRPFLAGG